MIVNCDGVNTVKDIHGTGVPNDVSGVDGVLVLHDFGRGFSNMYGHMLCRPAIQTTVVGLN